MWSEKAPKCKCNREKVIYICLDSQCHKNDERKYMYCNMCLEEGEDHQHFKHLRITMAMKNIWQKWFELKHSSIDQHSKATEFIKEY